MRDVVKIEQRLCLCIVVIFAVGVHFRVSERLNDEEGNNGLWIYTFSFYILPSCAKTSVFLSTFGMTMSDKYERHEAERVPFALLGFAERRNEHIMRIEPKKWPR